ncbi:hypothetical protein BYT27DRAFT_7264936 [Phlegmacium glaucopus]|nr:hypothetical protein BYT27DRAFT_7264936 [Phlegmacium glaucopus]
MAYGQSPMKKKYPRQSARLQEKKEKLFNKPKAATVVFRVTELLSEIIRHCSWTSTVNLAHSSMHAWDVVYTSIRQRVHRILTPFVDDLSPFFHLIEKTKSTIVGSAAWNVMTVD